VSHFESVAELQELDTKLDQIDHRVEHLPERAGLVEAADKAVAVDAEAAVLGEQIGELRRDQRRHEDEIVSIEDKAQKTTDNMYSGSVTAPKELEAMQEEIASLGRRREIVEDSVLELMEQLEPLDEQESGFDAERASIDAAIGQMQGRIEVAEQEAKAERAATLTARGELTDRMGPDLVAVYDKQRARMRGQVAVGRLIGATCDACHLELSAVEVDNIRHMKDDEPAFCPECSALLVR
jgi:predicted  nucleic acid-binding Zn-ribbon protein